MNLQSLQLALCAFNFGAICFVQVVHYPLFADIPEAVFNEYHRKHVHKTTLLLGITLTLELFLNIFIFLQGTQTLRAALPICFLILGWATTFLISVPQHQKLGTGFNQKAYRILLRSNAVRVLSWGGLTGCLLFTL